MRFDATELTIEELALQADVREYLDKRLTPGTYSLGLGMAGGRWIRCSREIWVDVGGSACRCRRNTAGGRTVSSGSIGRRRRTSRAGERRSAITGSETDSRSEHRRQRHGRTEAVLPSRYRER